MSRQLRMYIALSEDQSSALITCQEVPQPLVTPALGALTPSAGLCGHLHS